MSNHWHGVVSDPDGRLPEFLERFHRLVARAQNASLGRWENFWSNDKTSVVWLVSEEDVLEKIAYTVANPTVAGLVHSPFEWPGVISHRFDEIRNVEMPDIFFDEDGELPEEAELCMTRPNIFPELSDVALLARIQTAVAERVQSARNDMANRGLRFLGRSAILQQPFDGIPRTSAPRRSPSPRLAAKSPANRLQGIRRVVEFLRAYRAAWLAWRDGDRNATFPFGTYALRIYASVRCGQPP
ncbi:MAG: hypothetical protein ABI488_16440 [Polyangiaceae bacterium]